MSSLRVAAWRDGNAMKDDALQSNAGGIQVIARAARILRVLKENPSGMSLGQIAEAVHLPRSTVQRIVGALRRERMVIADANGRGHRLGPELSAFAEATRYNIAERCRPLLIGLTQATGETTDLSVLRGSSMIFLDQVPGTQRLRAVSAVGAVFPLTTTANGRACLAELPDEQAEPLAMEEWSRQGIKGDLAAFRSVLDRVRETGLAFDLDEHTRGISAVGFAFADWQGDLHSISVPVPTTRFTIRRVEVESAVRNTAAQIQKMLDQGAR